MLSLIDHHDSGSMRVIGALDGLFPKKDRSCDYHMFRYSQLNSLQQAAIARFLTVLPKLVQVNYLDQNVVSRALRNY